MVKQVQKKLVFDGRVTNVWDVDLDFGNGRQATYELITFKVVIGVSALPLTEKGVLLISHYQVGLDHEAFSLPTGGLMAGEDPQTRMQLELQEEIGFKAGRLELMLRSHPLPGYIGSEAGYLFVASDLTPSRLPGDEEYPIAIHEFTWPELLVKIKQGEIQDTRTLTALLYYRFIFKTSQTKATGLG